MDSHHPIPSDQQLQSACGFFSLPPELRLEIYAMLLPYPSPSIVIRARYATLRWMSASRAIFIDAAPAFYNKARFTTYTKLDSGTLANDFEGHLRLTYGPEQPPWLSFEARRLITHVAVDITFSGLNYPTQLEMPLLSYFATINHFPQLVTLEANFYDKYRLQEGVSDIPGRDAHSSEPVDPLTERIVSHHVANALKRDLPRECKLSIFIRGTLVVGNGFKNNLSQILEQEPLHALSSC